MTDQGAIYAAFIDDQLKSERERQSSLNDRGSKLQQSTSITVGLFVTALGMLLGGQPGHLTLVPLLLFVATVIVLAAAFLSGILTTRLIEYEVADANTFQLMLNKHWTDGVVDSLNITAGLNAKSVEQLRAGNNWKARCLLVGISLQGVGVVLGTVTFGVVAAVALLPTQPA